MLMGVDGAPAEGQEGAPRVVDAQRLMRIAAVTREVLEEARRIGPNPQAADHLRRMHDRICGETRGLASGGSVPRASHLTPDVRDDTVDELALAHAEILGWLQGLFQGAQLALEAQRAAGAEGRRRRGRPRR